ncbi:MAG TPA: FHA domain-containing protein [Gemmatimonadales bacterium]|nr:FHA domain-containing protein [Gemmatimonadales bacterium]
MSSHLAVLSGARAGARDPLGGNFVSIGRHPTCDIRFDPERDLDVSSRHAVLFLKEGHWHLRDLGSTNGTYVNGTRITGERALAEGDIIRFGATGPEARYSEQDEAPGSGTGGQPGGPTNVQAESRTVADLPETIEQAEPEPALPLAGTTTRVRIEVARKTRTLRNVAAVLGVLAVAALGGWLWQRRQAAAEITRQRLAYLAKVDSLLYTVGAMQIDVAAMRAALDSARGETSRLRDLLAESGSDPATAARLRRELDASIFRQQQIVAAATLDGDAIAAANRNALAVVLAETGDGRTFSATGFAVRTTAGDGLIVTNRHAVTGPNGEAASRLGVIFNGSAQNFKAVVLATHPTLDVALLKVAVDGGVPIVKGLAWRDPPLRVGDPAVVMGFPLGLDLAMGGEWQQVGISATLNTGTTSRVLPELLQLDGYGAQGSSGSPVFDRDGMVVGVLYGGEPESNGRIVYAVPVKAVLELLDRIQ